MPDSRDLWRRHVRRPDPLSVPNIDHTRGPRMKSDREVLMSDQPLTYSPFDAEVIADTNPVYRSCRQRPGTG